MDTQHSDPTPEKRRRAPPSGISLTELDAAVVKGMLLRGDAQSSVAQWFSVNQGRIAEIATGATFACVPTAAGADLPPPGPYLSPLAAQVAMDALVQAQSALERAQQLISRRAH